MDTKDGREGGMNLETGVDIYTLLLLSHFSRVQLCVTVSRSIHISANGTVSFFFMA